MQETPFPEDTHAFAREVGASVDDLLRQALEFYADRANYVGSPSRVEQDKGERARAALGEEMSTGPGSAL